MTPTPLWTILPFAGLLVAVAVLPLIAPHWWHKSSSKAIVSILFGLPVAILVGMRAPDALVHTGLEYASFISLLGSLFIISGGVRLKGSLAGTPLSNAVLLTFGALLANVTGTTGAAMLLLRPYLHANRQRKNKTHLVVFFILLVANCGGCLTPLGDPPLFLGFLKGVPFLWTAGLWREWATVCGSLVAIFLVLDWIRYRKDGSPSNPKEPLALEGLGNLALLGGVIGAILLCGFWVQPLFGEAKSQIFQCALLGILSLFSLLITPKERRVANDFHWHPLVEVVIVFLGIFSAMIPALAYLHEQGPRLGLQSPAAFFWATGGLSAALDNAPTYLAFLSAAQHLPDEVAGTTHLALAAISCGAVFFGAATYIVNGPNFMVKAIAEDAGVPMPSFF